MVFDSEAKSRDGKKSVTVGYPTLQERVKFQLGDGLRDASLCKWGAEPKEPTAGFNLAQVENCDKKLHFKLEVNPKQAGFVEKLGTLVMEAANANTKGWFGKEKHGMSFNSNIKTPNDDKYKENKFVSINLLKDTKVQVTYWIDEAKGKYAPPTTGTLKDLVKGSRILPIVRFQNGVYFMNKEYGISLAAESVLVIKPTQASNTEFAFGDDVFEASDANEDEDEPAIKRAKTNDDEESSSEEA